jgi:hypothetical protein
MVLKGPRPSQMFGPLNLFSIINSSNTIKNIIAIK